MPYTQENLKLALEEVWNKGGKTRAVSRKYGIPHTTLLDKLKFKTPIDARRGPSTVLTKEEEHLLVEWTKAMRRKGMPVNQHQFMDTVGRIIERDGRKTPFNAMKPGRKWMQLFMKRHPDISLSQPKAVGVAKTHLTETAVRQWHKSLANYILERTGSSDLLSDPRRIINVNESGWFTNSSLSLVLAPKKSKGVCGLKGNEKEVITVVSTFTANGDLVPPCVIYPCEQIPLGVVQDINPAWSLGKSVTGCLTSDILYCYIVNTLIPFLKTSETPLPVLVVVDSLGKYISLQVSHLCQMEGVILYSLLPNATHVLQPAEVGLFGPLKRKWRPVVEEFKLTTNENSLTLTNFASLLEQIMDSLDSDVIKNAFKKCGLYPFNEEAINFSKCIGFDEKNIKQPPPCNLDLSQYLFVQSLIPPSRIEQFRESPNVWKGDESAKELFYFWKNLKNCMFGVKEIENTSAKTDSQEQVTDGNKALAASLDKAHTINTAMSSSSRSKAGPSGVKAKHISPDFFPSILGPRSSVGKKGVVKRVTFSTAVEAGWKDYMEQKEVKRQKDLEWEENERKKLKMVNDPWSVVFSNNSGNENKVGTFLIF